MSSDRSEDSGSTMSMGWLPGRSAMKRICFTSEREAVNLVTRSSGEKTQSSLPSEIRAWLASIRFTASRARRMAPGAPSTKETSTICKSTWKSISQSGWIGLVLHHAIDPSVGKALSICPASSVIRKVSEEAGPPRTGTFPAGLDQGCDCVADLRRGACALAVCDVGFDCGVDPGCVFAASEVIKHQGH